MPRGPAPKDSTPVSPHLSHYTLTHSMPEMPSTPAPTKARINHLESQISELVRRSHAAERKHKSEVDGHVEHIDKLKKELKEGEVWKVKAGEAERIKAEGEAMREELNLHSLIQQQKALLAVVNEQMDMIDMEYQGLQEQSERVMRDYKITVFEAREDDLTAEIAEKDAQMAELEASLTEANTSKAHRHAAETKAAREESRALAVRVAALEKELKMARESEKVAREGEKAARVELETMSQEKSQDGAAEKERAELKRSLRESRSDLSKKDEQLSDLQEEFTALQEASKEREKTLKTRIKEAVAERDRLIGVEVELESLKTTHAKVKARASELPKRPAKAKEAKARKTPAPSESDDEILPAKKPRRSHQPKSSQEKDGALAEVSTNDPSMLALPTVKITDTDELETSRGASAEPEKKKKRKLFGAAPAFTWDPIMSSGDGVIPACLSPVKPSEKAASGTIPRKGFGSLSSSRSMSRLV